MDFNIFYKQRYKSLNELEKEDWDLYISAFNESDRVKKTFESVNAKQKIWIIHSQYDLKNESLPEKYYYFDSSNGESVNIREFFAASGITSETINGARVCIDSTGLMRQDLLFFILYLNRVLMVTNFDIIYSEPETYLKSENTQFSKDTSGKVKVVQGFELTSERDQSNDLLIIGSGFDDKLIAEVAEEKKHAQKAQIIGFPSLQADMYQQNLYRVAMVDEMNAEETNIYFSSASDPFETANTLKEIIEKKEFKDKKKITNLYLSPLSTKAQTVGFALFYIYECFHNDREATILIPETLSYSDQTSEGVGDVWRYQLEFPPLTQ